MENNVFTLVDGRKLGYAFYGPETGEPILYFHGTPSSRLEPLILSAYKKDIFEITNRFNIRLIAIDRPGFGLSDFNPKGTFTSFANDAIQLADYLQIKKIKIVCWSGGGSYSLATAAQYADRVTSVHIIAGFSRCFSDPGVFKNMSGNKYYFGAAKYIPGIMRGIMNFVGKKRPDAPLPNWLMQLRKVDYNLLNEKYTIRHFTKMTLNEACRHNSNGLVHEARLYYQTTGYDLKAIKQPVHYWWGTVDNVVTEIHATSVEEFVPNAVMHYKEGEGHLSLYVNYIEEILKTVART